MTAGLLILVLLSQGPRAVRVGPVTAVAWPGQERAAEALAREAARPVDWPGLGRLAPDSLILILVPDRRRLDSLARGRAPTWGAALAFPESRTILLRADGADLHRTLRHELGHLVLHQQVRVRVPLWFDEGYAALSAGEWERLGGLELNLAVARGAVPDFAELDAALRGTADAADAAYALAMSAVLELGRRNPTGRLDPLLSDLAAGQDFDAAVLATTGLTLTRFEDAWRRAVRTRYTLVTWLAAGGVWVVTAGLVVVLLWWRRRADRPRRAALDVGWEVPQDPMEPPPAA